MSHLVPLSRSIVVCWLPNPNPPLPRQLERRRRAPHDTGDALPEPAFEHRLPGNEGELAALLDDGDLAAGEPERVPVDPVDALAAARLNERHAGFPGKPLSGRRALAAA